MAFHWKRYDPPLLLVFGLMVVACRTWKSVVSFPQVLCCVFPQLCGSLVSVELCFFSLFLTTDSGYSENALAELQTNFVIFWCYYLSDNRCLLSLFWAADCFHATGPGESLGTDGKENVHISRECTDNFSDLCNIHLIRLIRLLSHCSSWGQWFRPLTLFLLW